MTPPPSLQELIDTVRHDAATEDPIGQLAAAAAAAADLEQTTDALLGHFVDRCRRAGRSWSEISTALGVTRQAVHKRFAVPLAERLVAERLAAVSGQPTFERFTPRARSVLVAAGAAARASAHHEIAAGHLLLGLYAEPDGIAARVLLGMQVSREQVEGALRAAWAHAASATDEPVRPPGGSGGSGGAGGAERAADRPRRGPGTSDAPAGDPATARLPMSPGARTTLVNAVTIALEFGHNYIGTEHILLALYRDPDGLAARVLAEVGAEPAETQARVAELLRGQARP